LTNVCQNNVGFWTSGTPLIPAVSVPAPLPLKWTRQVSSTQTAFGGSTLNVKSASALVSPVSSMQSKSIELLYQPPLAVPLNDSKPAVNISVLGPHALKSTVLPEHIRSKTDSKKPRPMTQSKTITSPVSVQAFDLRPVGNAFTASLTQTSFNQTNAMFAVQIANDTQRSPSHQMPTPSLHTFAPRPSTSIDYQKYVAVLHFCVLLFLIPNLFSMCSQFVLNVFRIGSAQVIAIAVAAYGDRQAHQIEQVNHIYFKHTLPLHDISLFISTYFDFISCIQTTPKTRVKQM
jgi:hypothetical protein